MNLAETYTKRRQQLMVEIEEGVALINSSGPAPDPLLNDKNLRYLTGVDDRKATLVLAPQGITVDRWETHHGPEVGRGREVTEALFVNVRDERVTAVDGPGETIESIRESSGVEAVYNVSKFNEIVSAALMKAEVLWYNTPSKPNLDGPVPGSLETLNRLRERYYWLELRNIARKIHGQRWVKDAYEIGCLREAFALHARIFEKIMRTLKPGNNESLGQAIFDYEVRIASPRASAGLENYANSIIVAGGANAAIAHYMDNNQDVKDGDLVLIDAGVAIDGYYSDITSTFPANGRFTARQRELYGIVLEAQNKAIAVMKPGATQREAHKAVYDHFKEHGLDAYNWGNCGHPVGLNIHDPSADPDAPLEPGVVLVIEPFLAIPEEGIGIRIENGVLITEGEAELLPGPPREIEAVEALCQSG